MKVFARDVVKMAGYKFKNLDFASVLFFSCPWDQFRVHLILLIKGVVLTINQKKRGACSTLW